MRALTDTWTMTKRSLRHTTRSVDTIITAVLMELIYMLDLGMSAPEAIAAPRIHHQWSPGELMVEQTLPQHLRTALQQRGHEVKELNSMAVSHIVARSPDGKSFMGAADPRAAGDAAGW